MRVSCRLLATTAAVVSEAIRSVYQSSYGREQLRERLHEGTVENALYYLERFQHEAVVPPHAIQQLQSCTAFSRMNALIDIVEKWYFELGALEKLSLHEPWYWFPKARGMTRRFYFHYGPTNSGKTFDSLQALRRASSGVYCAPLKALATQVWSSLNATVPCDLLIGDERRFGGSAEHVSCTVEMTPLDYQVDVAVIDEIQMIGDRDRGWAWCRALLGLPAREIHLCGEQSAVTVIQQILHATGEASRLRLIEHKRLVPLTVDKPLDGDLRRVQNGDCLVCFSRRHVFDYVEKLRQIPNVVPYAVYGAMPFAVREAQTVAFNTGTQEQAQRPTGSSSPPLRHHVLVATDAIAYGLNLNIRRMIFSTVHKYHGGGAKGLTELTPSSILQIAGRAGRFGCAFADHGFVSTLHERDLPVVRRLIAAPSIPPIRMVGIVPPMEVLLLYCSCRVRQGHSVMPLANTLESFIGGLQLAPPFFCCDVSRSLLQVARCLDDVPGLDIRDRIIFCSVPLSDHSGRSFTFLKRLAEQHARRESVTFLAESEWQVSTTPPSGDPLLHFEWLYRMCEVYGWLAWRLPTFVHRELVQEVKKNVVDKMNQLVH